MTKKIQRKEFLTLAITGAAVTAIGCSSDGEDTGGDGDGGDGDSSSGGSSSGGDGDSSSGGSSSGSGGSSSGSGGSDASSGGSDSSSGGSDAGSGGSSASGGSDAGSGGSGSGVDCSTPQVHVSNNHPGNGVHEITGPGGNGTVDLAADIAAGVEKNYGTSGSHSHDFTITADQFKTLQEGGTIHIFMPSNFNAHCCTISCGAPSTVVPDEDDMCPG